MTAVYDQAALDKLNWFLRDWRKGEKTDMDPHLIDLVWEVQRENGTNQPIWVVCGYRSPETNAMLRRRSSGVARFSQHMLGHAMDFYIPGANLEHLREIGLRLARGGVGFYPTSGSPFVHMDTGSVRMWPRMSHDELARVFPDGKTVQIPSDGKPLPGYAVALAEIQQRGNNPSDNSLASARGSGVDIGTQVASNSHFKNPFAKLLGLKTGDDDDGRRRRRACDHRIGRLAAQRQGRSRHRAHRAEDGGGRREDRGSNGATGQECCQHGRNQTGPHRVPDAGEPRGRCGEPVRRRHSTFRPNSGRFAALSPNQIINSRGYWQSASDGATPQSIWPKSRSRMLSTPARRLPAPIRI